MLNFDFQHLILKKKSQKVVGSSLLNTHCNFFLNPGLDYPFYFFFLPLQVVEDIQDN